MADLLSFVGQGGAEKRSDGHLESKGHHFAGEVALLAVAPAMDVAFGAFGHGGGVLVDTRAMEGGLGQAALAAPEIAFAEQKPLPEKRLGDALGELAFVKFRVLDDQNFLDVIRAVEENAVLKGNREGDNVPIFTRDAPERAQRITANGKSDA